MQQKPFRKFNVVATENGVARSAEIIFLALTKMKLIPLCQSVWRSFFEFSLKRFWFFALHRFVVLSSHR